MMSAHSIVYERKCSFRDLIVWGHALNSVSMSYTRSSNGEGANTWHFCVEIKDYIWQMPV